GKFSPIFVFQGFEKTAADACGGGYFGGRHFAHFALALQTFPKSPPGHDVRPVPDDVRATAKSLSACGARAVNTAAAGKKPAISGVKSPRRHYRREDCAVSNHATEGAYVPRIAPKER